MIFSEVFIRRPIMTVLVMVTTIIFGAAAYMGLPVSDLPEVKYPVITITVVYPGASPVMMAATVAKPIENECMQIQGLSTIISTNTESQSQITLTFELNVDVDLAAPDVQAAISRAMSNLPDDLPQPPTYQKTNPSDKPIIHIVVSSDTLTSGQLYDYGNTAIGQRLSMVEGVSKVNVWGAQTAVRVQVDPKKLAAMDIGIDEVAKAVKTGTIIMPAGSLDGTFHTFSIEPQGQLMDAEAYKNLIITYRNNAPVYLKDIAKCYDSSKNDVIRVISYKKGLGWKDTNVYLSITKESGANTVALSKRIMDTLEELKKEMPGAVTIDILYDQSNSIVESVKDVKDTIIIAVILVVLIIFLFLGRLSDTVIPSITLPIAIVGTFAVMYAAGFSLNNLSLMGLTLSVGFLVDDAIVVLENTVRHVEAGEKPMNAAIKSMGEITGTVISTSIALIIVFVPLVFMSGIVGRLFRELSLTVVAAIVCSTIAALTLTPMMCARMLKEKPKTGGAEEKKTRLKEKSDIIEKRLKDYYARALKYVLERRHIALIIWIICIIGTFWFIRILPKTFIPEGDSGAVIGFMQAPLGVSSEKMSQFQDKVNAVLQSDKNIEKAVTVTGLQTGADQSTGIFYAILKPHNEKGRQPIAKVVEALNSKLYMISDGLVFTMAMPALVISTGGESTATGSKYSYVMSGQDREKLYEAANLLEQKMRAMPGLTGIQNSVKLDMPQLDIILLRDRASTLGITAEDIVSSLSLAYAQGKVTLFKNDTDQYWVIVELDKNYKRNPADIDNIYVRSKTTGKLTPLGSLIDIKESVGPQDVPHYNQLNSATISFNLKENMPLGEITKTVSGLARAILPPGASGSFQGEAQQFQSAVKSMSGLLIAAIFLMYIVLGILYESYIHPFTILTTLPVAAFGGLLTLLLFRSELSLYAYIGVFMLLGIVSKNGIIMVDFAQQNLNEGEKNSAQAIYNACLVRFRPILMTGASTIIGALPIALGYGADGASRRPLGLIVVGGLIFAQVVTLFVTPGIYLYMQEFQENVLDRWELSRSGAASCADKPK
ncbi:MAG: efflux RND transporter permease subunit [Candidatus Omnitrophica bacterium]|nr:efflux RND transporter permease subunit [Candidatus Omnitrophota bacterium]